MGPLAGGAGIASSIFGAVTGAAGASQSGSANSQAYLYQSHVADVNAQIARQNSATALMVGEDQASVSGAQTRQTLGQERAGQGASGLDVNSGSALLVRGSTDELGQRNQATIRDNAAQRAYGFNVTAAGDTAQAGMDTAAAANAKTAGDIGAASSIIGGAGSVASKWLQGTQVGLFNSDGSGSNLFGSPSKGASFFG